MRLVLVALVLVSAIGFSSCALTVIDRPLAKNEYNLKWLRQHISVVSQEPVLFQTTIRENILFGCDSATEKDIENAARMANAHDFIMTLPDVS